MNAQELEQAYTQASWLIAKKTAATAGKALVFSSDGSKRPWRRLGPFTPLPAMSFPS